MDTAEAKEEFGIDVVGTPEAKRYDAIILAIAHTAFVEMGAADICALGRERHVLYDIKCILPKDQVDDRL